jgi:mono/diheme cytochrome c family protein/plastocyanin
MTDQPGHPPEERLPAPRPSSTPEPAERFSAPPSAHRNDLTPERAAGIVRQSASARWVGFLAIIFIALFVIVYYFYELGMPGGLTVSRLQAEASAQAVTAVERGYNIYEANCARCHGVDGEGGIGPALNRQDKLFAHLSPDYIRTMLQVGGRYACGNANSLMPVWSNTGSPPGPLNYRQIENVIAFIRAEKGQEYRVLDPNLLEPSIDPNTGKDTFEGWVDPNYTPEPGATPYPACWEDEFTQPSSPAPSGAPGESPAPSGSEAPAGAVLEESATNIAFDVTSLSAPADTPFQIHFKNNDAGIPHNIEIKDSSGTVQFKGEIITGVTETTYNVPALPAGTYPYICSVHPNMTGTLPVGN